MHENSSQFICRSILLNILKRIFNESARCIPDYLFSIHWDWYFREVIWNMHHIRFEPLSSFKFNIVVDESKRVIFELNKTIWIEIETSRTKFFSHWIRWRNICWRVIVRITIYYSLCKHMISGEIWNDASNIYDLLYSWI